MVEEEPNKFSTNSFVGPYRVCRWKSWTPLDDVPQQWILPGVGPVKTISGVNLSPDHDNAIERKRISVVLGRKGEGSITCQCHDSHLLRQQKRR